MTCCKAVTVITDAASDKTITVRSVCTGPKNHAAEATETMGGDEACQCKAEMAPHRCSAQPVEQAAQCVCGVAQPSAVPLCDCRHVCGTVQPRAEQTYVAQPTYQPNCALVQPDVHVCVAGCRPHPLVAQSHMMMHQYPMQQYYMPPVQRLVPVLRPVSRGQSMMYSPVVPQRRF